MGEKEPKKASPHDVWGEPLSREAANDNQGKAQRCTLGRRHFVMTEARRGNWPVIQEDIKAQVLEVIQMYRRHIKEYMNALSYEGIEREDVLNIMCGISKAQDRLSEDGDVITNISEAARGLITAQGILDELWQEHGDQFQKRGYLRPWGLERVLVLW